MFHIFMSVLWAFTIWISYLIFGAVLSYILQPDNALCSLMLMLFWPIYLVILLIKKLIRRG